jgi:hypothetical protein
MNFLFNNPAEQKLSFPLHAEPISIGCEAWIDVSRFSAGNKFEKQNACDLETSENRSRSAPSQGPLAKSFTLLRKKLRRGSDAAPE